jgi:foldase protein PrsA
MVRYIRLALVLVIVSLLLANCGAPATETPAPTNTPQPSPPARPTDFVPSVSQPTPQTFAARVEAALKYTKRLEGATLATVDGEEITWEDYEPALRQALLILNQEHDIDWEDSAMQQRLSGVQNDVLKQVVDRFLLRRIAADQGITVSEEKLSAQAEYERTKILDSDQYADWDSFLEKNGLTQETFEQVIYETLLFSSLLAGLEVDAQGEQIHIAHIVVNDELTAQEVFGKLQAGEEFSALAAEYSIDEETKDSGGDLGWFTQEIMAPEIGQAAFSSQPGQFSSPISTEHGYSIILVLEREMRELDQRLLRQRQQEALMVLLQEEQAQSIIEYLVDFAELE